MSTLQWILLIIAVLIGAAILTRYLAIRGMRTPWVLRLLDRTGERIFRTVQHPLTVVVFDEVADVLQTGQYTRNISAAVVENRAPLKNMIVEKVTQDPNARHISKLPGYHKMVDEITESALRIVLEVLADPRTDEFIADLLRTNLQQIEAAVRNREHENVPDHAPPDPH